MLSACTDSARLFVPPADPATLCVESACGTKTRLLHIGDAENIHFTPDGRLFVSGGQNVYEVTRSGDTWNAEPISASDCNFTGLAQRGNVLYATCFSGTLFAATLSAAPSLEPIHTLTGMTAANGTVLGPEGALYIVNGPVGGIPDPKIVRLRFNPSDAFEVVGQTDWLTEGLEFPNGLTRRGRTLFVTDGSSESPGLVKTVEIMADGSPGALQTFATSTSILDDLSPVSDHLLLTEYSAGSIALVGPDGSVVARTAAASFDSPSAVRVGRPPLFETDEILVTEKGTLQEPDSDTGNALAVFRRSMP